MGACVTPSNQTKQSIKRSRQLCKNHQKSSSQISPINSEIHKIDQPILSKLPPQIAPKSQQKTSEIMISIPDSNDNEHEIKIDQLDSNDDDDDDIFKTQMATSKIYSRSKIQKMSKQQKLLKKYSINLDLHVIDEKNQIMEGIITEENGYSKINIYSANMAMEFTIPKSRAGPLMVPVWDYGGYLGDVGGDDQEHGE